MEENSGDHNYSKAFAGSAYESEDDVMDEELVDEDIMFRKRKSSTNDHETVRKNKTTSSDDPRSDNSEESGSYDEFSDENIIDSDMMPESKDETNKKINETINLGSSFEGGTPSRNGDKKDQEVSHNPEFWSKVEELKNKGFSIEQAGLQTSEERESSPDPPSSPFKSQGDPTKLAAFTKLSINCEHEKICMKKCFMMAPHLKVTWEEFDIESLVTPDFVKGCIRVVMCCMRLGESTLAREAINLLNRLARIQGISALCHALISGVKNQSESLEELEQLEEAGMESLRKRDFTKALEFLDECLSRSSGCIRLKMARGDCLAHLSRYVEGAKAASGILQQDQDNVGALFLRGFCLYNKNNLERAVTHFQQVLQQCKNHKRAKMLLVKARIYKEKKDAALKAVNESRLEDARKIYTEAIAIDPRNKGTNASLFAERAEVYFNTDKIPECIQDCEASLAIDPHYQAALLQRGKCHMKLEEWGLAVRVFERLNGRDRHNQQIKKKAGEAALESGDHEEAYRLFTEAVDIDQHNKKYRHLLKEAKQKHLLATRIDLYEILGIQETAGDSEIKKAYFKKSKEYHPDKHANADDQTKEEFSAKFKQAKEAYETLSDIDRRKAYDEGVVKPPPGGWYQEIDKRVFQNIQRNDGAVRGGLGAPYINIRGVAVVPVVRGPSRGGTGRGRVT